jgi:hypothetical protein
VILVATRLKRVSHSTHNCEMERGSSIRAAHKLAMFWMKCAFQGNSIPVGDSCTSVHGGHALYGFLLRRGLMPGYCRQCMLKTGSPTRRWCTSRATGFILIAFGNQAPVVRTSGDDCNRLRDCRCHVSSELCLIPLSSLLLTYTQRDGSKSVFFLRV